jgi:hypothetical protein
MCMLMKILGGVMFCRLARIVFFIPALGGCAAGTNLVPSQTLQDCGQPHRYGSFSVQARSANWKDQRLIIDLLFTNTGREPTGLTGSGPNGGLTTSIQLVSSDGIKFDLDGNALNRQYSGGSILTSSVNPGITLPLRVEFQVPKGSYALDFIQATYTGGGVIERSIFKCSVSGI